MVPPLKGSGTGGRGRLEVVEVLHASGVGGYNIRIRDVEYFPTHWEGSGRISPLGDM